MMRLSGLALGIFFFKFGVAGCFGASEDNSLFLNQTFENIMILQDIIL